MNKEELNAALYSDRARACSDAVNLHFQAVGNDCIGLWVAIRLSDGGSDGNLYPTKADAKRFQLHDNQCAYVNLVPGGMSPRQAQTYLTFMEGLYDAGLDLADPDMQIQMPNSVEQHAGVIDAVRRGK